MTKTKEEWNEDRWKRHEPDALPNQIERKILVLYGIEQWNQGSISFGEIATDSNLVLAEHVITLGIPPQGMKELKGKMLAVLEEKKGQILAENHVRLKEVQDKIDNLLAIEDKSSGGRP